MAAGDPTDQPEPLTPAEVATYRRAGYIIPRWRYSEAEVAGMLDVVADLIESNPDHRPEQLVCPHLPGGATKPMANDRYREFLDFAAADGLRQILGQLVGPNVLLWGSQLFCKPAAIGMEIPWHQDGDYWPIRPLATTSVWIAIDKVTRENACLRVIPGSHRQGPRPHVHDARDGLALDQTVAPEHLDLDSAVDIELEPGQMVLFDAHLMHGSTANSSGKRRAGMVYRFMPATSLLDRKAEDKVASSGHVVTYRHRPLYQVLGTDPGANTLVRETGNA